MSAERANASASSARISGVSPDTARRSAAHHACAGRRGSTPRSVDPNHPTVPDAETAPSPESPNAFATAARPRFATPASAHARRALAERRRDAGAEQRARATAAGAARARRRPVAPRPSSAAAAAVAVVAAAAPGGGGRVGRVARARALGVRRDRAHQRLDHASPVGAIAGRGKVARGGGERVTAAAADAADTAGDCASASRNPTPSTHAAMARARRASGRHSARRNASRLDASAAAASMAAPATSKRRRARARAPGGARLR